MSTSGFKAFTQSMQNTKKSADLFRYPSDLFSPGAEPYILFDIRNPVAKDAPPLRVMALYMPPSLKVRYNAEYENIELKYDQFTETIQEIMSGGIGGFANVGIYGASKLAGLSNDVLKNLGRTVNPQMAVLFRAPGLREFQFDFQMMAKNKQESDAIFNIIKTFKYAMHPEAGGEAGAEFSRMWFYHPHHFYITLYSPRNEYLFSTERCVLVDMNVDYAGSGVPSFFTDTGAPVDIRLSLSFKETVVLTKEDIRSKNF